uniref:Phospholipase A2 n=1 Tax=Sphenodon punctatus TaxID=8508 RepID=A0A8D0L2E4_SPHPU
MFLRDNRSLHITCNLAMYFFYTVSQSDCYVKLWLPTASFEEARTQTVFNCKNPVWNEVFYFRIQSLVKNILELKVCDENTFTRDEELCTVRFDVANLGLGERVCLKFELNSQVRNEITGRAGQQGWYACLCDFSSKMSCGDFTFTVKGSYEETQNISLDPHSRNRLTDQTVFHYVKYGQPQMEVTLPKKKRSCSQCISLCSSKDNLDVRLGFDLCKEEQDFICQRKKYVATALKKVLQLEEDLQEDEVPVVAVMTTAGGVRSMTGMLGSLLALQKLNFLDCISYISGLSGTTWLMSKLYEDVDWSQKDLKGPRSEIKRQVLKNKLCCFSLDRLQYYEKEMCKRNEEGHKLTFADLWGLILESMFWDEADSQKLSDQKQTVNHGQNPLPIYLALNVKKSFSTLDFKEWVEFTPYEIGFLKYGAFVCTEDFGSEFFMGRLMKRLPESRISFMIGMWSNIFSQSVLDALYLADCSEDFWHRWTRSKVTDIDEEPALPKRPDAPPTRLFSPSGTLSKGLREIITKRPVVSQYPNFLKGLQLNNKYLENDSFCEWKDTVLDSSPNQLNKEFLEHLELVDTAFFINTSCPPLLRRDRQMDLILHLNYSGGEQTLPLDLSTKYYAEQGIPFPKVVLTEEDRKHLKECYLFEESEDPRAPIYLYFPLVCDTFQKYKAPGVLRSPEEMEEGQANFVDTFFSPFATGVLQYSEANFNKILNVTGYNIENNEHLILQALRTAVERKKQQKKMSCSLAS